MQKILTGPFFTRPALRVARDLIGKHLIVSRGKKCNAYLITETEAYVGPHDKGCHAYKGRTKRTETLYREPGILYVYLVYGMHHMLNVVTDRNDYPAAVLIRGVENISGPGRLTKRLGITMKLNGKPAGKENNVWFEDRGTSVPKKRIRVTPRIGIDYAEEWKDKPFRFILEGEK